MVLFLKSFVMILLKLVKGGLAFVGRSPFGAMARKVVIKFGKGKLGKNIVKIGQKGGQLSTLVIPSGKANSVRNFIANFFSKHGNKITIVTIIIFVFDFFKDFASDLIGSSPVEVLSDLDEFSSRDLDYLKSHKSEEEIRERFKSALEEVEAEVSWTRKREELYDLDGSGEISLKEAAIIRELRSITYNNNQIIPMLKILYTMQKYDLSVEEISEIVGVRGEILYVKGSDI